MTTEHQTATDEAPRPAAASDTNGAAETLPVLEQEAQERRVRKAEEALRGDDGRFASPPAPPAESKSTQPDKPAPGKRAPQSRAQAAQAIGVSSGYVATAKRLKETD